MMAELQVRMQEHSNLTTAVASITALCEDEKGQRLALAEQVASLQQQLTERDQTVADMQVRLQTANKELRAAQSSGERADASLKQALSREAAVRAEWDSARQRAALAEGEVARLSSVVADLEQQRAATLAVAAAVPPVPVPSPTSPSDSGAAEGMGGECDAIIAQFAHVSALRDALQQREELRPSSRQQNRATTLCSWAPSARSWRPWK
jgi:DNA repair exonuclease SbcCD ATPase subunit